MVLVIEEMEMKLLFDIKNIPIRSKFLDMYAISLWKITRFGVAMLPNEFLMHSKSLVSLVIVQQKFGIF
nr:MAG TPA: hypothetical protein [Caudoviricetes sp.]